MKLLILEFIIFRDNQVFDREIVLCNTENEINQMIKMVRGMLRIRWSVSTSEIESEMIADANPLLTNEAM